MTPPLFVNVGSRLINLSACESIDLEDETLSFTTSSETYEVEFGSEGEAAQALAQLRQVLESKNLLLGSLS